MTTYGCAGCATTAPARVADEHESLPAGWASVALNSQPAKHWLLCTTCLTDFNTLMEKWLAGTLFDTLDVVFSGEHPDLTFVEIENQLGHSVRAGTWSGNRLQLVVKRP